MQGKEVLIPLHGSTLIEIDHKNKRVIVDLPEGLLDVYLA
jgi:16S rRNA processing protein RimM